MSSLVGRRHPNQQTVLLRAIAYWTAPRNSFPFTSPSTRTAKANFVLTAIFHSSSHQKWKPLIGALLPYFYSFITETIIETDISSCEDQGIVIRSENELPDLKCAQDAMLLNRIPLGCRHIDKINYNLAMFGILLRSAEPWCRTGLVWSRTSFMQGKKVKYIFYYPAVTTPSGCTTVEMSARTQDDSLRLHI